MPSRYPEEAKNFRLLGHAPDAAWGGGSLVQVKRGHAYVGAVGGASFNGPEGFTVHDVSDPTKPRKVNEFRAPPGVHMHKLRLVGEDILYVNSERLPGEAGKLLVNLLSEDHSRADEHGRHTLVLEGYGYRWYRVGGLDYLLKRSDIDTDATGKASHPA